MTLLLKENGQWFSLDVDNDLNITHVIAVESPPSTGHAVAHNMAQVHAHAKAHVGLQAERERHEYAEMLRSEGSEVEVTATSTDIRTVSKLSQQLNDLLADPGRMGTIYPGLKGVADAMLAEIAKKGSCSSCTINAIRRRHRPTVAAFLKNTTP